MNAIEKVFKLLANSQHFKDVDFTAQDLAKATSHSTPQRTRKSAAPKSKATILKEIKRATEAASYKNATEASGCRDATDAAEILSWLRRNRGQESAGRKLVLSAICAGERWWRLREIK